MTAYRQDALRCAERLLVAGRAVWFYLGCLASPIGLCFQYPRWPFLFPPGTPKELVQIMRDAMRKAFADPEFPAEFTKLMGDGPSSLGGEELEKVIRELPRDKEVVELYKKLAGADPLPAR